MLLNDPLKVAVVGTGGIFIGAHMRCYPKLRDAILVGFYDIVKQRAEYAARKYEVLIKEELQKAETLEDQERLRLTLKEIRVYSSFDELLDDEVDIVDVCTPPRWHDEVAIAALKHKHHVMVEKPMTRTWLESREVVKVVKESGMLYQHNENAIYAHPFRTIKKIVDSGILGDLISITVRYEHDGPEGREWFWDPLIGGGGCLVDMAPHSIALIWFLVGFDKRPIAVKSCTICTNFPLRCIEGRMRRIEVEDYANIKIVFKDMKNNDVIVGNSISGWSASLFTQKEMIRVSGSEGHLRLWHEEGRTMIEIITRKGSNRKLILKPDDSFANEIRNFVECVKSKCKPITDERVGSEIMAIIGAAYLSELNKRETITLDQFKSYALDFLKEEVNYKEAANKLILQLMKPYKA